LTARAIPRITFRGVPFYNLRLLREPSLVDRQAAPEERDGVDAFMARFRLQAPDRSPEATVEPLARLRAFLGAPGPAFVGRFSDGSYPVVYLAEAEQGALREVSFHLARTLAESDAAPGKSHYFMLAEFTLAGEAWDVRKGFPKLHLKDDWRPAQAFGAEAWAAGALGVASKAVRRTQGSHVAVFRAQLVKAARKLRVVGLRWDGAGLSPL
jgi:hypothetical protein